MYKAGKDLYTTLKEPESSGPPPNFQAASYPSSGVPHQPIIQGFSTQGYSHAQTAQTSLYPPYQGVPVAYPQIPNSTPGTHLPPQTYTSYPGYFAPPPSTPHQQQYQQWQPPPAAPQTNTSYSGYFHPPSSTPQQQQHQYQQLQSHPAPLAPIPPSTNSSWNIAPHGPADTYSYQTSTTHYPMSPTAQANTTAAHAPGPMLPVQPRSPWPHPASLPDHYATASTHHDGAAQSPPINVPGAAQPTITPVLELPTGVPLVTTTQAPLGNVNGLSEEQVTQAPASSSPHNQVSVLSPLASQSSASDFPQPAYPLPTSPPPLNLQGDQVTGNMTPHMIHQYQQVSTALGRPHPQSLPFLPPPILAPQRQIMSAATPAPRAMRVQGNHNSPITRKILSLDGGGVRGLSIIIILEHLMKVLGRERGAQLEPWQEFDMIAGTSTVSLLSFVSLLHH
jgi:hypothetical protein